MIERQLGNLDKAEFGDAAPQIIASLKAAQVLRDAVRGSIGHRPDCNCVICEDVGMACSDFDASTAALSAALPSVKDGD